MNKEINLVVGKKKEVIQRETQLKVTRFLAIASLVVVISLSVGVFLINQLSGIQGSLQKEKDATQNISFFQKKIGTLLLTENRMKDIDTLIKNQSHLDVTIKGLMDGIPDDVRIDSLTMTRKDMTMTLVSSNLESINSFLDFIVSKVNNNQLLSKLTVNNIIADTTLQKYIVSIKGDLL